MPTSTGHDVPGWRGWTREEFHRQFWGRVDRGGPNDCWLWTASVTPSGYGKIKWRRRIYRAHRLAYRLARGPLRGRLVLHTCDVPRCCNPAHLYLGTQSDNILDSVRRGRHHNAKLDAAQVKQIRKLREAGKLAREIAPKYGISLHVIYAIDHGRAYAWVT